MYARLACLLCVASALTGCARSSAQAAATVLGQPVYAADVTPTPEELRAIREPEMTPQQRRREEQRARLTSRVIRPLEARYVRERNLQPTEEEIGRFIRSSRARGERIEDKLYADLREQRQKLQFAVTPEQKEDATVRVAALEALLAIRAGEEQRRERLDDEEGSGLDEDRAVSERELAGVWVATWKFHRALYREFGGAVAWRDTGPEPVGAYRKWLESLEAAGDFTIADPDLRDLFWTYWRRDADVVMDPEKDPFATPWWLDGDGDENEDEDESADLPGAVQSSR